MPQHKLSASSNSVKNSGLTDDYRQAIAEYIWNGFDAEATTIDIRYEKANELGTLSYLLISDNGKGINKKTLEYTFGSFLDSQKKQTYQRTSNVRGKKGKGRFSFQMFAYGAEWTTRYLNEEGKLMQYSIVINIQDLSTYTDSDEIELDKSIYSTGTDVKFLNIHNLAFEHITSPSFCDYIAQQFAWFLCLNETKGYNVKLNGIDFDYEEIIAVKEETDFTISNKTFNVAYIRWSRKIGEKFYYYMMDSNLQEIFKELTSFNNNKINFFHSVYVNSPYFDKFCYEKDPKPRFDGFTNQSDPVYKRLLKQLKKFLTEQEKVYVNEVASEKLVEEYEAKGIIPSFKASQYEQIRKQDLVNTIKQIYSIQPKIFKGLRKEQQKTLVAFLNLLLDSEERDKLLFILDDIVSLTEEERAQFAKVLNSTSISRINKVVNIMHHRLESVEYLKTLVYDLTKFTTEREHIQKVIEKCFWLFGEQYNLVSADTTFEKALAEYIYILDGKDKKDKIDISNPEHNRRPDIFLCRQNVVNDANSSSMLEENIIVELKRPSVNIGKTQHRQIEDYLDLIKNEPRFNATTRIWKFIVIGKTIEKDITDKYESFKHFNKRYLTYQQGRFEIYAMSWDDVFQEFKYRHQYILGKLKFNKDTIRQAIADVESNIESANTITQKILQLQEY